MAAAVEQGQPGIQPQQNVAQSANKWTDAKIKKVVLYVLATVGALAGVALLTVSAISIIPWPFAFGAILLFAASGGLIYWACSIKDYDNPVELQKMTEKAWDQSYSKLREEHGDNIVRVLPQLVINEKRRYESELHGIHLKYPQRQECLIAALNEEARKARVRAERAGNDVRMLGTTASLAGSSLTRRNEVLGVGLTATMVGATVVDYMQERDLRKELEVIEAQKREIYTTGAGMDQQRRYQAACMQARQVHDERIVQMRAVG